METLSVLKTQQTFWKLHDNYSVAGELKIALYQTKQLMFILPNNATLFNNNNYGIVKRYYRKKE